MFPYMHGFGVDAVPLSTFLCDFYLKYRRSLGRHTDNMQAIPLTELERIRGVDVAVNAYSFSEMSLSAVNFWLHLCADLGVKYFMLVPHSPDFIHPYFVTSEPDGSHLDYFSSFEFHGYKLIRQQPKFPRELAPSLIYSTDYCLFARE